MWRWVNGPHPGRAPSVPRRSAPTSARRGGSERARHPPQPVGSGPPWVDCGVGAVVPDGGWVLLGGFPPAFVEGPCDVVVPPFTTGVGALVDDVLVRGTPGPCPLPPSFDEHAVPSMVKATRTPSARIVLPRVRSAVVIGAPRHGLGRSVRLLLEPSLRLGHASAAATKLSPRHVR